MRLRRQRADVGDVAGAGARRSGCGCARVRRGHAVVPPGRYRVDAETDEGGASVRGLTADDAPFQIQALSSAGDVRVGSGP